ncbi:branched-chain amino acid ABC transporter permease [Deinococcus sp. KNUC1210]|uniref:branched-chain amino acid ABC transporter permease n=1 Tax=Deinococcus sp. KNUC1210 TaxID=2917691 RepID=UPI001EF14DFF|nr:branched-chain amino acid ABC transporter permease [Deinococcus sp. KNUC1210]ULH15786.1 branched-chain amino acid ABC transporter permease [Deinococcus sp. KNUC1210]
MTALSRTPNLRPSTPDRTVALIVYTVVTSLLLFLALGDLTDSVKFPSVITSGVFLLFLGSLLLAYQWKANNIAKLLVGAFVLLIAIPDVGRLNGSYFDLAIQMCIFAALALGLNIVVGQAGLLDLGYVAFFAVGAYVWGIFGSGQFQQIVQSNLPYTPMGVGDWLIPLILTLLGVAGYLWMKSIDRAHPGAKKPQGAQRAARSLSILLIVIGVAGVLTLIATLINAAVSSYYGAHAPSLTALATGINPNFFWLFIFIAVATAAISGVLIGLPVLKLKGDYLAIVTLGLGEVIRVFANNLTKYTNGPQGITSITTAPVSWVDKIAVALKFPPEQFKLFFLYFLVLVIIAVVITVNVRLGRSNIGRAWVAIREDELAAQAMGVPLVKTKIMAFATGASFAGVMGVIFAAKQQFISPESFSYLQSIGVLTMVILGGMGNIAGVILGAIVVTWINLSVLPGLSETIQSSFPGLNSNLDPAKYNRLLFGVILVLMMLFRPEGLLPSARQQAMLHENDDTDPAESSLNADGALGGALGTGATGMPDVESPGMSPRLENRTTGEKK